MVFDPDTYQRCMPWRELARLREREPVTWVEELPVDAWPAGPGFWAVWRHADAKAVLRHSVSDTVDRTAATPMAQAALAVRPEPGPDGGMPDPRTRAGIPDLYAPQRTKSCGHIVGSSEIGSPASSRSSTACSSGLCASTFSR